MINGFYTTREAAQIMGLGEGHIRTLCNKGKMQGAQKMGWAWVIPEETVKNYKPGPQGYAAVWEKIKQEKAAIQAEKAALLKTQEKIKIS